ncbi:MAG: YARHG domain-containing protein [Pyrinomonadaceae bacterium]
MNKYIALLLLVGSGITGCNFKAGKSVDSAANGNNTTVPAANNPPEPVASSAAEILGSFVGPFGDNKITMLITKADGTSVSGRTIVGGNDRPFDGTFTVDNGVYKITASEPGDHKDDGAFNFTIASANPTEVSGTWKPNDTKRSEKSYTLKRKQFEYKTNVGNWPLASQRVLKESDVENLDKSDLTLMRNEIFARHGYCFSRKEMRQQFENEDWYVPNTVDIKGYLTDIEKKNILLIKRYEKYAEEYGDVYGR